MRNYGKIQVAVKRFRVKIVHAQNLIRRSIVCNQARYQLLEMQWDKVSTKQNIAGCILLQCTLIYILE